MLDETIITETPPLHSCYGHLGEQVCVPITGNRAKRIVHGALNIRTGAIELLITDRWNQETHQYFPSMIRRSWKGWSIILFEDRGSHHTAFGSLKLADKLNIQVRLLPVATPELNAMDHLWRHVKNQGLLNRATESIDVSANAACQFIWNLTLRDRLIKAGVLSGTFWFDI